MSFSSIIRSASARVEEKIYTISVSFSVYIGLVRASLQDRIPSLQNHGHLSIALACLAVVLVQALVGLLSLLSWIIRALWSLPTIFASTGGSVKIVSPLRLNR